MKKRRRSLYSYLPKFYLHLFLAFYNPPTAEFIVTTIQTSLDMPQGDDDQKNLLRRLLVVA